MFTERESAKMVKKLQKVKVPEQDYFTESKRDQNKQMFTESESAKFVYNFFL